MAEDGARSDPSDDLVIDASNDGAQGALPPGATVAARLNAALGTPAEHPWRGVMLDSVLPMDIARIAQTIPSLVERIRALLGLIDDLACRVHADAPRTPQDAGRLARFAARLSQAPRCDAQALTDPAWEEDRARVHSLLERGRLTEKNGQLRAAAPDE